jgi:hypothetical protein
VSNPRFPQPHSQTFRFAGTGGRGFGSGTGPSIGLTMLTATFSSASSSASASFDSLVASLKGGSAAGTQAGANASADEGEDRFLKLLVAQMNNQDPLSPMDNAQVTSQLAQINTVKGIDQLNGTMQKLLDRFQTGGPADAVPMVGRQVLVPGDKLDLPADGVAKAGFELASGASAVTIGNATRGARLLNNAWGVAVKSAKPSARNSANLPMPERTLTAPADQACGHRSRQDAPIHRPARSHRPDASSAPPTRTPQPDRTGR